MTTRSYPRRGRGRRGVILILVLGVLGLMAVIGVTFATFTGQARMAGRSFAQSKYQVQSESLMDFALSQLIMDTNDVRSAIRGHSLARDMYGNDALRNGYIAQRSDGQPQSPGNDVRFYVTQVEAVPNVPGPPPIVDRYMLTTNIAQGDPLFYGYSFLHWTVRISFNPTGSSPVTLPAGTTGVIDQSFEIVAEDGFVSGSTDPRRLVVVIKPSDVAANLQNASNVQTYSTISPAYLFVNTLNTNLGNGFVMTLDGRWLNAFNGPGMRDDAKYGNFRYNTLVPGTAGMDEDYDAVDLENWFLAMQSADGQVVIPSFHRPAVVRYDPLDRGGMGTGVNDWDVTAGPLDRARILRPRLADGNDAATFPDLIPGSDGKIDYDVDNDGDGVSDSVWVDLGYPARRNAQGTLYKPLFAFMVIGLNGRIPLNTAGNLAGRGSSSDASESVHATHLGNSVSEIDPSYGLQNNSDTGFSQYDNAGVDVRVTQLRNILAGTRPQPDLHALTFDNEVNGDTNQVQMGTEFYAMPNGIADGADLASTSLSPGNVIRLTPPVAGRWGEPESVPGGLYSPLVPGAYRNEVRPGYSITAKDLQAAAVAGTSAVPKDAADDDYNAFDVYPTWAAGRVGEVGDDSFLDAAGALLLPVERMVRFLTPVDINGTGSIRRWNGVAGDGGDFWGRIEYRGYYRPAGLPAQTSAAAPGRFPWTSGSNYPSHAVNYTRVAANEAHDNNILHGYESFRFPNLGGPAQRSGGTPAYRDLTGGDVDGDGNPRMGVPRTMPTYNSEINATVQSNFVDESDTATSMVAARSDALNAADELNLYNPDNNLDAPFSYSDLEWLYRYQDVDAPSLKSRLADLAPISFLNAQDGMRRRRLYSIDTWESNTFSWANDNPGNAFSDNSRFANPNASASMANLPTAGYGYTPFTPSLAQRGRKINLNMPLPASNNPHEPIRQKWITDAYHLFKTILPPRAVDTPEELAQLGQYLVNVIDFRDPDCAMTIWDNPDVYFVPAVGAAPPTLSFTGTIPLRHYGMEYNPIAINEVLSYSYQRKVGTGGSATPTDTGRFFVELVNTLTKPRTGNDSDNAGIVNLSGFNPQLTGETAPTSPYDGACWDLVFTGDEVATGRPDPFTGQIQPGATLYGVTPLGRDTVDHKRMNGASTTGPVDVLLKPLSRSPGSTSDRWFNTGCLAVLGYAFPGSNENQSEGDSAAGGSILEEQTQFGSNGQGTLYSLKGGYNPFDSSTPAPTSVVLRDGVLPRDATTGDYPTSPTLPTVKFTRQASVARYLWVYLRRPANPLAKVSASNPMVVVDSMRFRFIDSGGNATTRSTDDPLNSGRFDVVTQGQNDVYSLQRIQPYRGGQAVPAFGAATGIDPRYGFTEQIAPAITLSNIRLKYGTAETQISGSSQGPYILHGANTNDGRLRHTLGLPNDPNSAPTTASPPEPWDFFAFNDRDFTSLYELTLVPGVGPGLFTKRFAEFAPSTANQTGLRTPADSTTARAVSVSGNVTAPTAAPSGCADAQVANRFDFRGNSAPVEPHTYPYLVDKFFYTAYGASLSTSDTLGATVDGFAGDGWFKMFEFLEVPSQSNGAIGSVAQGTNFDWFRQDVRPGLMNLNLIMDEEAFYALLGRQNLSEAPALEKSLNPFMVPEAGDVSLTPFTGGVWDPSSPLATGYPTIPLVVTSTLSNGAPGYVYPMPNVGTVSLATSMVETQRMKAAFAQFLWSRHGGSGFLFGFGEGETGRNNAIMPPVVSTATDYGSGIPREQPFRSPSYPDVGLTVLRPAALKPSQFTDPPASLNASNVIDPLIFPGTRDPGLRNNLVNPGYDRTVARTSPFTVSGTNYYAYPPAIPVRRFFQPPDAYAGAGAVKASNASLLGDSDYNNLIPTGVDAATGLSNPVSGGLPPMWVVTEAGVVERDVTNGVSGQAGAPNIFSPENPPVGYSRVAMGTGGGSGLPSLDQHPYFRSETMQRVMNLTTPRTHQFAVWITIGLFEVIREGDITMIGSPLYSAAAFDTIGPEIGAATSENKRYRSFFVIDRLKLTGFDPDSVSAFRPAVVYRRTIQ